MENLKNKVIEAMVLRGRTKDEAVRDAGSMDERELKDYHAYATPLQDHYGMVEDDDLFMEL